MRFKFITAVVAAALSVALLGATSASAATEFGSNCTANRAEEGTSFSTIQLTQNGAPTAAPTSGVVTSWRIRLIPVPITVPQQLKVYRPTANPTQFQVVGESAVANVSGGDNTFPTRIPIQAGDRLGLFGNSSIGTLFCAENPETENPGNSFGVFPGNPPPGSTATVAETETEVLVPAIAVIEADADNDGFGDETQDKCPQNAAVQVPCPVVALSTSASARKTLATVLVTSSLQAAVTVAGTVDLGKGKTVSLSGGTQIVTPGAFAKFTVLFPQKLKAKLKQLSRKRFLWLNLSSTTPNAVGPPTVSNLKLKLKGQAKPKPKRKAKG
ncbi:MAG TPA: hypothetical protein VD741_08565 [Solirubrobacterales bacterium]|nr:hypothetical protein [Solirubrobacterales bacterium]